MKECSKCAQEKPACDFYARKGASDGLYRHCKACHLKITSAWAQANREKKAAAARAFRARDPERAREIQRKSAKKSYQANPQKYRDLSRKNYTASRVKLSEYHAQYRSDNAHTKRAYFREYYAKNAEHIKKKVKLRRQEIKVELRPYNCERQMRRRANKRQAVPAWANIAAIRLIYERCAQINAATGIAHHVDHIVPLQSVFVCGLHVEHNLQILPASENHSKGNRIWPDCPDLLPYPKPKRRKHHKTVAAM